MDERYKDEKNLNEHLDEMDDLLEESQKSTIKEDAEEVLDSAGDMVDDGIDTLVEKTGDLFGGLKNMATGAVESVGDIGANVIEGASDVVSGTSETIGNAAAGVLETGSDAVGSITDTGADIVDGVTNVGSDMVESGSDMISGAAIAVGAAASGLIGGAKKLGSTATEKITNSTELVKETVAVTADTVTGAVEKGAKNINEKFSSAIQADAPPVLRPKDIFEKQADIPHPALEEGEQKITRILSALRDSNFAQDYGILMYLIAFPIVLLVIWQFIQNGFSIRMGLVVLLGIFFLIYRGAVKGITREVFDLKSRAQSDTGDGIKDILSKANYVLSGIELNLKRISYTKWLYTLFTPFLLYGVAELWKGPFDTKTSFWLFLVGFIMSFVIWPFAFRSDVKKLESLEMDLVDIRRTFL